ncbi:DUF4157 domain-containing protein [Sedimentitalea sp. HM32M-2]|uniref:eCIS core domain-containing protein n=1 Tax=Sedimentitalea sp. HM32M-2 TaxID=3351566 RepID=UPI0036364A60
MSKDSVKAVAETQSGKKASIRKYQTEPADTKELKLPKDVREGLEAHFSGAKLSKVRVHMGGNIKEVGKELKAKAFTIGQNLYVTKSGDAKNSELLAHELTHVIQQAGGKMPKKSKPGTAFVAKK